MTAFNFQPNWRQFFSRQAASSQIMLQVMLACVPGIAVLTYFFGAGVLANLLLAASSAVLAEALVLKLRRRSLKVLRDNSAVLTGVLLGICLPASAPWWLAVLGASFAILLVKQVYGGLGANPFNPAMAAYALLLISFPLQLSQWPELSSWALQPELLANQLTSDTLSGATLLDAWRNKGSLMAQEFWASLDNPSTAPFNPQLLQVNLYLALAWLFGGGYLIYLRLINWQLPLAFLATIFIASSFIWGLDSSHYAPPWLHLTAGATLFGAFFILTDPVSGATSLKGKIVFGIGAALILVSIRTWGNYPDSLAFAVLLMNFAAPALDYFTKPRVYGQQRRSLLHPTTKQQDNK